MVVDAFHTQAFHEFVESEGRVALEPSVGLALAPHAIDDVATFMILLHHVAHHCHIVLQVGIDANGDVGPFAGSLEPGQKGILMSHIASKFHATHLRVLLRVLLDELPCVVDRAVVDIEYTAFLVDELSLDERIELFNQFRGCYWQHFLLIVTGNHDIQNVLFHDLFLVYKLIMISMSAVMSRTSMSPSRFTSASGFTDEFMMTSMSAVMSRTSTSPSWFTSPCSHCG